MSRQFCRARTGVGALLCLLAPAGCGAPAPPPRPESPALASLQASLLAVANARAVPWPADAGAAPTFASAGIVVLAAPQPDAPPLPPPVLLQLREQVRAGTSLLLLGQAAALAHALGCEPVPPDRVERLAWGYDARTVAGTLELGLQLEASAPPMLADGLVPIEPQRAAFWIAGGAAPSLGIASWRARRPTAGRVLARLVERRDGVFVEQPDALLIEWPLGRGRVLACGIAPEPSRPEPQLAANAARLLANLLAALGGERAGPIVAALAPERRRPSIAPLAPLAERRFPGAHPAPWWGFVAAANRGRAARTPIPPELAQAEAIDPAARAGAALAALHLQDRESGLPLPWSERDPIARPFAYRGQAQWAQWSTAAIGGFAAAAHAQGLAALLELDPLPVRGGQPIEQLAAAKWLARDLLDPAQLGPRALDGMLLASGLADVAPLLPRALGPHAPDGLWLAHELAVLDAADGRPRGVPAAGCSERWRDAPQFDTRRMLRLDASLRDAGGGSSGGGHPDWLALQVQDFVRRRIGDAALLWTGGSPDELPGPLAEARLALSLAPLDAALAMRLLGTGRGGWRDLLAARLAPAPGGFGAESDAPAETAVLQNNHFRLHGSGGALQFDPTGRARLRPGDGLLVSPALLQTRVTGARPSARMAAIAAIDFVAGRPRGEGEYGAIVTIGPNERGAGRMPARLQRDAAPVWPRRVELQFTTPAGSYELEVGLRGLDGPGIVELWAGGEPVRLLPFRAGGDRLRLPLPITTSGLQSLALELVEGGAVALDVCRLERDGDLATGSRILEPGGARAVLEERTTSSAFREVARWTTHADLPGMLWEVELLAADRGLRVTRRFELPGYRGIARGDPGAGPFVLAPADPRLPPLAIVPLELPAGQAFVWNGTALELAGPPETGQRIAVGLWWLRDQADDPLAEPAAVTAWWREIQTPPVLEIGDSGTAALAAMLPFAAVRVLRLHAKGGGPVAVRERDWWLERGVQPARDGGDWLRLYTAAASAAELRAGAARRALPHPGPGARHALALRELAPDRATVVLLAPDPLLPPSLRFPAAFASVRIDGARWDWFDGDRVFLPRATGDLRVELQAGDAPRARLARSDADVRRCAYDAAANVLEIFTVPRAGAAPDTLHHAWIAGPAPIAIDGGRLLPVADLRLRPEATDRATGFRVLFAPGLLRIRFAAE